MRKRIFQLSDLGRPPGPGDFLVIDNAALCDARRIPFNGLEVEFSRMKLRAHVTYTFNRSCTFSRKRMVIRASDIGQNVTPTILGPLPSMLYLFVNTPTCGRLNYKVNATALAATWQIYGTLHGTDKFYFPFLTFLPTLHLNGVDYLPSSSFVPCADCFSMNFRVLADTFCAADAGVTVNALLSNLPFCFVP